MNLFHQFAFVKAGAQIELAADNLMADAVIQRTVSFRQLNGWCGVLYFRISIGFRYFF